MNRATGAMIVALFLVAGCTRPPHQVTPWQGSEMIVQPKAEAAVSYLVVETDQETSHAQENFHHSATAGRGRPGRTGVRREREARHRKDRRVDRREREARRERGCLQSLNAAG